MIIVMKRFFIYLSYSGTNYSGWQIQPNAISVQEVIEKALSTILRKNIPIVGAGRTDAGVHARKMIAHFDLDCEQLDTNFLVDKLNGFLPYDIAIHNIVEVKSDAHARFDATSRLYRYYITTRKDPFLHSTHYRVRGDLDIDAMNVCANALFDFIDFTSFSKLHTDVKTNNCKIMQAFWVKNDSELVFTIQADRFLRNMVRAIVGTLLEVGKGKLDERGIRRIIETKDRRVAGTSVPGHALFLEDVTYPEDLFEI